MKITTKKCQSRPKVSLGDIASGTVVRFPRVFSERHRPDDIFIINSVCNTYVPDSIKNCKDYPQEKKLPPHGDKYYSGSHLHPHDHDDFGKIAVTNLRTGSLSYVLNNRVCIAVETEVCYSGDAE